MVKFSARSLNHIQAGCIAVALLAATGPARAGSEKVVYSFKGGSDGLYPEAGLINVGGTLYGTTGGGGSEKCRNGCGTVFSVTPAGAEAVVHSFKYSHKGRYPEAGLINVGGTLYGTTIGGGRSSGNCGYGCGTVFSVTSAGTETVVYAFGGGSDGAFPKAGLINMAGTLYGTTQDGGASNNGTAFAVTP
jgi:uncharacterized repeat protein (TIGR03803 family)